MQKPKDALELEFNKGGIFFLESANIDDSYFEGKYIGVEVEIVVLNDAANEAPQFSVSIVNRREVALFATNWKFLERNGQKLLSFSVYERIPEGVDYSNPTPQKYMSFLDLCFYAGNEAIPEVYGEDIVTKPRPEVKASDLGWCLPSRFVDALIDTLGKLDNTMLGGNIKEALLYGPYLVLK